MNRRSRILLCLVLAMMAGIAGYSTARQQRSTSDVSDIAQQATDVEIKLYRDRAVPDAVILKVGETATFASADSASHSLSLGSGTHGLSTGDSQDGHAHQHVGDFSSGEFASDEAWQATFHTARTYEFHDHLHPGVRITVIAYQPIEP